MKRLPGVLLFLILVLFILEIFTLRTLSQDEKKISALEKKVESLQSAAKNISPDGNSKTKPVEPAS